MNKKISVFDSNKEHKNPIITTGIVILGILLVIDCLQIILNLYFWGRSYEILGALAEVPVYKWLCISVIVLGCICTKNKALFVAMQCVFSLFLLQQLFYTFGIYARTSDYIESMIHAVSENDPRTFVNMLYPLIRPIFVLFAAAMLAKGLFMPHKYKGEGYLNMALHIILLLIMPVFYKTCWVFRSTRVMNRVSDEPKRNAFLQMLLCFIVPFYSLYWTYSTARRGDVVVAKRGVPSNTAALCLILQLFLPIVPPIIIQDKINQILGDNKALFTAPKKEHIEKKPTPAPNLSIPDELKKYKELLDCQAITQEEYDKKKSELLNL